MIAMMASGRNARAKRFGARRCAVRAMPLAASHGTSMHRLASETRCLKAALAQNSRMEIIPAIDLRGGHVVRLRQGDFAQETVYADDPIAVARAWVEQGAQRL